MRDAHGGLGERKDRVHHRFNLAAFDQRPHRLADSGDEPAFQQSGAAATSSR
jgi:hypothetical protein